MVKDAATEQSKYMKREIVDEVYSVVDNIEEILDLLSDIRKQILQQVDFINLYNESFEVNSATSGDLKSPKFLSARTVLKVLYHFGAIGNVTTGNHQIYGYNSMSKNFNERENMCIHRSLLKVLDIY